MDKETKIIFIICFYFFISVCFCSYSLADSPTIIGVQPSYQKILPGESFTFSVTCTPARPVKSFELKIKFDASVLQINDVSVGTLFDGYQHFPSMGTIDNNNGYILDVFDLILGSGNVTTEGTCILVSGIALSNTGNISIELYDVGVTDENGYLPITVVNGFINVQSDIILTKPNPGDGSTRVSVNKDFLSIDIHHKFGEEFHYSITTNPDVGSIAEMDETDGTKICEISNLSYRTTYSWTVKVQEKQSGNWTNQTFSFKTVSKTNGGSSSGGGTPPPPIDESPQNNPPSKPLIPSEYFIVEPGVPYVFETNSYDIDNDLIRYRFDWGDNNISNWSDFQNSNVTINMTHQWWESANYTVSVCAQDEQGMNSSWSDPIIVTCKTIESIDRSSPPIVNFTVSEVLVENSTIQFNASYTIDSNIDIVLYAWDFGDGTNTTGINPNHTYQQPGDYTITLTVTDAKGNTRNITKTITISPLSAQNILNEDQHNSLIFFIFGFILIFIAFILFISRERIIQFFYTGDQSIKNILLGFNRSFGVKTFLDGMKKGVDFSKNVYVSVIRESRILFQKTFQREDEKDTTIPVMINPYLEKISVLKYKILNENNAYKNKTDQLYETTDIVRQQNDPVYDFFHKYSIHDVRKKIDTLFMMNNQNDLENMKEDDE